MSIEEYGSSDSVSGDQENDNGSSHKSSAVHEKSPGQSSSSSSTHADDEGGSPCSAQGEGVVAVDRMSSSSIPQQFERVSTDSESTCARTDLVYIHPPVPIKQMQASTTKVRRGTVCACYNYLTSSYGTSIEADVSTNLLQLDCRSNLVETLVSCNHHVSAIKIIYVSCDHHVSAIKIICVSCDHHVSAIKIIYVSCDRHSQHKYFEVEIV